MPISHVLKTFRILARRFAMNPSNVILHVVHPAKDSATNFSVSAAPFAPNTWVVFGFVTSSILFGAESTRGTY